MAEAVGLTLGSIALASLFKTCLEFFEYFESASTYVNDYELVQTKICLLKTRLSTWAARLNIETPGGEHTSLKQYWLEEKDVIGRSLFGIKRLFEHADVLINKHKLTSPKSQSDRSSISSRIKALKVASNKSGTTVFDSNTSLSLRQRTSWAVHDKERFNGFITDLSFLIENLESVTERLDMSSIQGTQINTKPSTTQTQGSSSSPPKAIPGFIRPFDIQQIVTELAKTADGNIHAAHYQSNTGDAIGVIGTCDDSKRREIHIGHTQINDGRAMGVVGSVSSGFAARKGGSITKD